MNKATITFLNDAAARTAMPWPKLVRAGYDIFDDPTGSCHDAGKVARAWADIQCPYPVPPSMHPSGRFSCVQRIYSTNITVDPTHVGGPLDAVEAATNQLLDILRYSFVGMLDINRDDVAALQHQDTN